MSIAGGFAWNGFRPFVYSIANFPTFRCLEQIRNDICHMNNPVTIVSVGTGFSYGTSGYSHYLIEDLASLYPLDISIYSPATPEETRNSIASILQKNKPAYIRLPRVELPPNSLIQPISQPFPISKLDNADLVLVALGSIAHNSVEAGKLLSQKGLRSLVFSCDSFDDLESFVSMVDKFHFPIFSIEEHILRGGLGSRILESTSAPGRLHRLGINKFDPLFVGNEDQMRQHYGMCSQGIAREVLNRLQ
jgi:transketolase